MKRNIHQLMKMLIPNSGENDYGSIYMVQFSGYIDGGQKAQGLQVIKVHM